MSYTFDSGVDEYALTIYVLFGRPVYIFFGGMVQIFGAVGEWILGNTFSSALFFTYGMQIEPSLSS